MARFDSDRSPFHGPSPVKPAEIKSLLDQWIDTVCASDVDDILELYEANAILHPTISPVVADTSDKRREYFVLFKEQGDISARIDECHTRIFNEVAVNSGVYTFIFTKDGKRREIPARFSFTYRKTADGWKIVDHHSSTLPEG